jgi:hypothetical protein
MLKDTTIILALIAALGAFFTALWHFLPTWGLALYGGAILAVLGALWRVGKS